MWKRKDFMFKWLPILLPILVACTHVETTQSVDRNCLEYNRLRSRDTFNNRYLHTGSFVCTSFDSTKLDFKNGEIQIEDRRVMNTRFHKIATKELSFMKDTIDLLSFDNCTIETLAFSNCSINDLSIINCRVGFLNLFVDQVKNLSINTGIDTLDLLVIKSPQKYNNIRLIGNFKEIHIEGGEITGLDISKVQNDDCNMTIVTTKLVHPQLYNFESPTPSVFLTADFSNAYFSANSNSMLKEELEVDKINSSNSFKTGREEIKKRFAYLITAYYHLSKVFANQKKYELSDYFEYRAKVCERKSFDSHVKKIWYWFFHEKLRGNYGTDILQIMFSFLFFVVAFSLLYMVLGLFKIAFCYSIKLKNSGEDIEEERPVVISLNKNLNNILSFYLNCFLFSFNQMLLGSISRDFVRDVVRFIIHPPKRYVAIGVGKTLGLIQYVLGIILLFFFLSAFLRFSR